MTENPSFGPFQAWSNDFDIISGKVKSSGMLGAGVFYRTDRQMWLDKNRPAKPCTYAQPNWSTDSGKWGILSLGS